MKSTLGLSRLFLFLAAASVFPAFPAPKDADAVRWEEEARNVTIIRDDWGIAHVYGKRTPMRSSE